MGWGWRRAQRNREEVRSKAESTSPESGTSEPLPLPLFLSQSLLSPSTLPWPSGVQVPYSDVEVLKTMISVAPLTNRSRALEVGRLVLRFLPVRGGFKKTKVPDVLQV